MSHFSAGFFSWLQSAPFYVELHAQAVALLPEGVGRNWLDVGCGPGLLARQAAAQGYSVLGIDPDMAMVQRARRNAKGGTECWFEVGSLANLHANTQADVVSATSLLFVLADPEAGLRQLWECVRPGGQLLIVETTPRLTPGNVCRLGQRKRGLQHVGLYLWALARRGRAINNEVYACISQHVSQRVALAEGLISATVFNKPQAA